MWIISYTRDYHYRDNDNYPACRKGEVETAEGETLKDAINTIILYEARPDMIKDYVDYDSCLGSNSIEIISVYKVSKSVELEFEQIPDVKRLIVAQKKKNAADKIKKEKKAERDLQILEKEMLKKLKEKYDE